MEMIALVIHPSLFLSVDAFSFSFDSLDQLLDCCCLGGQHHGRRFHYHQCHLRLPHRRRFHYHQCYLRLPLHHPLTVGNQNGLL